MGTRPRWAESACCFHISRPHRCLPAAWRLVWCAQVSTQRKGTPMARFTSDNAAAHGRRGGQRSHQHLEQQYAHLVRTHPSQAERVAHLIRQGFRLTRALNVVKLVDKRDEGGR